MAEKLRIISGKFKGRVIQAPANLPVRPTTDFGRTGLFNLLASRWQFDAPALDLFSGLGSVGFECLSRGAPEVWSVDNHLPCLKFQKQFAALLGLDSLKVHCRSVTDFLQDSLHPEFGLIFADPPYGMDGIADIPQLVFSGNWLLPDGWLVIEHNGAVNWPQINRPGFTRNYGKVHFSFFQNHSIGQ